MANPSDSVAFPAVIALGDTVYVGGQFAAGGQDIEEQTAAVFDQLVATLATAGAGMSDLINLRTYYVYSGHEGPEVTEYWNRMTAVRLRYLADPGPAATALRVLGAPGAQNLIGIDAIASLDPDRQRIMPEHAWDWTIPTPFSQGWRIADKITVGGQISADRNGKALAPADVAGQAEITLEYIRHVLLAAGQSWSHVVAMRIGYKHDADRARAESRLAAILRAIHATLPEPRPAITAIGVDLLYEGLLLEIDAVARRQDKQPIAPAGVCDWVGFDGFPPAQRSGGELYIGGLSAPGGASLQAQIEATFDRLLDVIDESGHDRGSLIKITLFYVPDSDPQRSHADRELIMDLARRYLPDAGPVVTLIAVPGLPHAGQRFQIDGVAVQNAGRVVPINHRGMRA
jgi:enamine deaminase RidA (YjgF/YER057c/UK114 family)